MSEYLVPEEDPTLESGPFICQSGLSPEQLESFRKIFEALGMLHVVPGITKPEDYMDWDEELE
jgi:hypothetical protein